MRTRGLQPRLLYPARLSIKIEGQIKSFPDKRSLKEYISTKPPGKRCQRDSFKERKENREKERNIDTKKSAMNKYLSIITLNANGLNA